MIDTILALKNVIKKFDRITAVSDLSIQLRPGEICGLIGPNGSGKTTTIKMIAGLYRPTAGVILIRGFDVVREPKSAKKYIGYVPDDPNAYDRLTGREFLEFVGELYSMNRAERDSRIDALLSEYKIEQASAGLFGYYSRGTKQKINIIAALLHKPALLLIDEPMVGLDPEAAVTTKRLLKEFAGSGGTIFLATHTLPIADDICTRIGVLRDGILIEDAETAAFKANHSAPGASLEAAYLNFISKKIAS